MMLILGIVLGWLLLCGPLAILVGRCIAHGDQAPSMSSAAQAGPQAAAHVRVPVVRLRLEGREPRQRLVHADVELVAPDQGRPGKAA
jgi:hypothetical protein